GPPSAAKTSRYWGRRTGLESIDRGAEIIWRSETTINVVIPGCATWRRPGIHNPRGRVQHGTSSLPKHQHRAYGFRAHRFAMPRNDDYCRSMIRGSVLSGTRRHWALSSASNVHVSPLADCRRIWPWSSRHCVGAKAVTVGSHFGFRKTWKLSWPASVLVRVRPQIDWPLPRTIAQSPIIWSIDLASERAAARFCRM